jgi:glutaredoxin-like protein
MIPLRDQGVITQRFRSELLNRVRIDYFTQKPTAFFVAGREECAFCGQVQTLLEELVSLSERIALNLHDLFEEPELARELGVHRVPAIVIRGKNSRPVRFFGTPSGGQFPRLVDTLIDAARGSVDLPFEAQRQLKRLKSGVKLQVFVSPTCPYSPHVARIAHKLALHSPRVTSDVIEVVEYPALVQRYAIREVPVTVINEERAFLGVLDETTLVQQLLHAAEGKPLIGNNRLGGTSPLPAPQQTPAPGRPRQAASGLILPH